MSQVRSRIQRLDGSWCWRWVQRLRCLFRGHDWRWHMNLTEQQRRIISGMVGEPVAYHLLKERSIWFCRHCRAIQRRLEPYEGQPEGHWTMFRGRWTYLDEPPPPSAGPGWRAVDA